MTSNRQSIVADAGSAIAAANDPKRCVQVFRRTLAGFGVDTFASGEVDLAVPKRAVFYAIGWPDSWRKFYLGSGLLHRDPVVEALRRHHHPFSWTDLRRDKKISAAGSESLRLIAAHGWTEGLAVPIPRDKHRFGLVSLVGKRGPFDATEKALLAMLSLCFHERLRALAPTHGFALPPLGLTKREIDCLRLIARGATDREIARAMAIAPATAHEFFEKAKKKLQVSTRAQAIAIAVSLGIVAP